MRRFYGYDDINEATYAPLSEAMRRANTPGIYERVLRDACRIRTALTLWDPSELDTPLLTAVPLMLHDTETWETVSHPPFAPAATIRELDDYVAVLRAYIERVRSQGAVGLKAVAGPYLPPDRQAALEAFDSLRSGAVARLLEVNPLRAYLLDQALTMAGQCDLVVAVHTGYWGDFRKLDPLHVIPWLERHPEVRFDIFHLGYPWVRETLMLAKGFANVWLNLCWTHIISQHCATQALAEALDLLPTNKILAFGGDYHYQVEKVYGHLVMAREDVARALAWRIRERRLTVEQALAVAHRWFWENPVELYRLRV